MAPRIRVRFAGLPSIVLVAGLPWTCTLNTPTDAGFQIERAGSNVAEPPAAPPTAPPREPTPIARPTPPPPAPVAPPRPKQEEAAPRETLTQKPAPTAAPVTLPDEVIVKALDAGQALFMRCFKKANDSDPTLRSVKIRLHLELGADGAILSATSDAEDPDFKKCLERVARMLPFPAPKRPAVVDFPLFFRAS